MAVKDLKQLRMVCINYEETGNKHHGRGRSQHRDAGARSPASSQILTETSPTVQGWASISQESTTHDLKSCKSVASPQVLSTPSAL